MSQSERMSVATQYLSSTKAELALEFKEALVDEFERWLDEGNRLNNVANKIGVQEAMFSILISAPRVKNRAVEYCNAADALEKVESLNKVLGDRADEPGDDF